MPTDLDILEEHEELVAESDDDSELVKRLRGELRKTSKRAKDRDSLFEENTSLKTERLIDKASLTKDGEKVSLTERQRTSLLRELGPDATSDQVLEVAAEFGWADVPENPADSEIEAQERIASAQRGGGPGSAEGINAATFAGWDQQRQRAFLKKYPEHVDALKRGETVRGISF